MSSVAIIPARGGSRGIPKKNLRVVAGMSLLESAILTSQVADSVERVIVSTDSKGIAEEAMKCGAEVLWRPIELATDEATTQDALRHAIESCNLEGTIVLVQCTNPFLAPKDIDGCVQMVGTSCDFAVCVVPATELLLDEDGEPINWTIDATMRQERASQWRIAGSCWAMTTDYCMQRPLYSGTIGMVPAAKPWQIDIDTWDDLRMAEALLCQ